jgi:hypothetical protein
MLQPAILHVVVFVFLFFLFSLTGTMIQYWRPTNVNDRAVCQIQVHQANDVYNTGVEVMFYHG